ncbi:MAG TPA: serine/threonine-protein kinase [Gemmataceae bacterium]|nr:serine/threonine-protein kinase [Gemmataceae bacterium]
MDPLKPRSDVRSDPPGDALHKTPPPPSSIEPADDDAVNLLDGSIEPTDDSPTVISKTPQSPAVVRVEDVASGGLRGRRLAHFELIEPIGVGGMAAVLRARDKQLDRLVALKILPPEMAADPENVRRFHQEARSAARLDHENIARVFFCGEDQRLYFIAFEFVEGDNLRTILEKRGRLPVGEALHYMLQVAAGLAHAARRGVVHRDIKPSNIIITPNGRAKLVDMGLARSLEPQHDQGLTQSGVTLGTFDYISPEQALEPRDADVRSDIYSLGCTFYHMLTGQPPVPEGTGLKKLHHHQHVKPPDPRQLVPDLPDEVAIILDRMMAKQPKDRYQTPEHLVHHLYLAARKLGAAGEVPEGVLAVEAALPNPPAGRPLVLAAVAAIAVVGLIFLVDASSTPKPQPETNPPVDDLSARTSSEPSSPRMIAPTRQDTPEDPMNLKGTTLTKNDLPPTFDREKPTAAELDEWLKQHKDAPKIIVKLDDLDLRDNGPDLVIANPEVEIKPRRPGRRPTIRDEYRPISRKRYQASLTIKSKRCIIENIRFVLNQTGASAPMAMLWLNGTQDAHIRGCEFLQADPCSEKDMRMTSVLADSENPAALTVMESCFLGFRSVEFTRRDGGPEHMLFVGAASGGQDAITRRGPVSIEPTNCLFGPHAATFRLERAAGESSLLRLKHCSVLAANPSAVYDVADGADAHIQASYSVFSYPADSNPSDADMMDMAEGNGAVLVRRASSQGQITYQGADNRYHHLRYLVVADASRETVLRLRDGMNIKASEELETFPWKDPQPLDRLKDQVQPSAIQAAFAVDPTLPEMRVRSQERASGQLLGAERILDFSYLDNLPPLIEPSPPPPANERVVRKGVEVDEKQLLFPTLDYALVRARSGDIIRLQVNGEIQLNPRLLSGEKSADLTIRADPGFHPILIFRAEEQGDVAALVEVRNGKLQLEGLEVRFQPPRDSECALVSFLGDGECVFKKCLFTLERSDRKTALAVLPEKRLKKTLPSTAVPRLVVDGCFIRGHGDLLRMRSGHSAEVMIANSLLALSGSLLNIDNDKKDRKEEEPAATESLLLHLHRVTTYLGEHLIRLRAAKDISGLPRTRCEAGDCLFLPARDRALVRLEGPEVEARGLRDKMSWVSLGKNAYGAFTALMEQQPVDLMRMPSTSGQEKWPELSGEMNSIYKVKLADPPAADALFTQLLPTKFRPADDLKGYGPDLAALGSLPALENKKKDLDLDSDLPELDAKPGSVK